MSSSASADRLVSRRERSLEAGIGGVQQKGPGVYGPNGKSRSGDRRTSPCSASPTREAAAEAGQWSEEGELGLRAIINQLNQDDSIDDILPPWVRELKSLGMECRRLKRAQRPSSKDRAFQPGAGRFQAVASNAPAKPIASSRSTRSPAPRLKDIKTTSTKVPSKKAIGDLPPPAPSSMTSSGPNEDSNLGLPTKDNSASAHAMVRQLVSRPQPPSRQMTGATTVSSIWQCDRIDEDSLHIDPVGFGAGLTATGVPTLQHSQTDKSWSFAPGSSGASTAADSEDDLRHVDDFSVSQVECGASSTSPPALATPPPEPSSDCEWGRTELINATAKPVASPLWGLRSSSSSNSGQTDDHRVRESTPNPQSPPEDAQQAAAASHPGTQFALPDACKEIAFLAARVEASLASERLLWKQNAKLRTETSTTR